MDEEKKTGPTEELVEFRFSETESRKTLKVKKELNNDERARLETLLKRNLDVFAWCHEGMEGIDPIEAFHKLNINLNVKPIRQK